MPFALIALAMINVAVGTQGFAFAGVLADIAKDLGISIGQAGFIVGASSITFAIGAPIAASLVAHVERRRIILASLFALTVINALCALVETYLALVLLRVAAGIAAAFIGALATVAAAALVAPEKRGRAFAIVMGGLTVAFVAGVPIGSVVGGAFGWRATFWLSAAVCALATGLISVSVPQIKPVVAPAPVRPTLAAQLTQAGADTSTDAAFSQLLKLWGASYQPGATDGCTQASAQGLECVTLRGSLAQLRDLSRPAILMLSDSSGKPLQAVLTGIGDEEVQLQVGARSVRATIAELSRYWFGDYVLLWHPGVPTVTQLRSGTRGPAVRQLHKQLLKWRGADPAQRPGTLFDDALKQLVEDFQREHHLAVDGIAGMETQLSLDAAVAAPGTPVLSTLPAGA